MASDRFQVELTRSAEKDLQRLRSFTTRAANELMVLEEDAYRGHPLSGSLEGVRSLVFSLPGGAYRAAYVVLEDASICLVFQVGPHEGFYAKAARRYAALKKSGQI